MLNSALLLGDICSVIMGLCELVGVLKLVVNTSFMWAGEEVIFLSRVVIDRLDWWRV